VTCQVGAEAAVKREAVGVWPGSRFAFSRPGFLTFKLSAEGTQGPSAAEPDEGARTAHAGNTDVAWPRLVLARASGASLGEVEGTTADERAAFVAAALAQARYEALHVWQRDLAEPGRRGFEPGISPAALEAEASIRGRLTAGHRLAGEAAGTAARQGALVLDCMLVEPDAWWLGWHRADDLPACWPGGFYPAALPAHAVSRAYLKMAEALAWSGLAVAPGQVAAEIGCAPGGASQALLDRGLHVTGIDPALVDPRVAAHPHFTQVRKRGHEVRRREFRKTRWLFADINLPPAYTLDTLEAIVTHREVHVRGLIANLKLADWALAEDLPAWLARVRSWGFAQVRARQLHHNRREVCVAAMR
jgi:23S rRNA (cytidine2498-2'-O)-methyltransferase